MQNHFVMQCELIWFGVGIHHVGEPSIERHVHFAINPYVIPMKWRAEAVW